MLAGEPIAGNKGIVCVSGRNSAGLHPISQGIRLLCRYILRTVVHSNSLDGGDADVVSGEGKTTVRCQIQGAEGQGTGVATQLLGKHCDAGQGMRTEIHRAAGQGAPRNVHPTCKSLFKGHTAPSIGACLIPLADRLYRPFAAAGRKHLAGCAHLQRQVGGGSTTIGIDRWGKNQAVCRGQFYIDHQALRVCYRAGRIRGKQLGPGFPTAAKHIWRIVNSSLPAFQRNPAGRQAVVQRSHRLNVYGIVTAFHRDALKGGNLNFSVAREG